jgi:hypothetical protein
MFSYKEFVSNSFVWFCIGLKSGLLGLEIVSYYLQSNLIQLRL